MRKILLACVVTILCFSCDDNYESQEIKPSESAKFELDEYGQPPLHWAIINRNTEAAKDLIKKGSISVLKISTAIPRFIGQLKVATQRL